MRKVFFIPQRPRWMVAWAIAGLLGLSGCVAPKVAVRSTVTSNAYRRVYLAAIKSDPLSLQPQVAARLALAGFTVMEINPEGPPMGGQGSGFLVNAEGQVLTCAHVVDRQTDATVWIRGVRHSAHVVLADKTLDAAIIQIDGAPENFRPLLFSSETNYHMGRDVFTMGFPLAEVLGTSPRLTKGLISSTVGLADDPKQLQISAEVQPGNSGGPLLNERGEVVGMVASTLNPMKVMLQSGGKLPQNVNFATKTGPLLEFLARANVSPSFATNDAAKNGLDEANESITLIRGGVVEEKDLHAPILFCRYSYAPSANNHGKLGAISMEFYDLKSAKQVLNVRGRDDSLFPSEGALLDKAFAQISARFFPDRQRPFTGR